MKILSTGAKYRVPSGTYFSKGHTWIRKNIYGLIKIGVDDFIVKSLDEARVISVLGTGSNIKKGDPIFELSGNAGRLILYSPINCKIAFNNPGIIGKINEDPYEDDWITLALCPDFINIKDGLLSSEEYTKWIEQEVHHVVKQ